MSLLTYVLEVTLIQLGTKMLKTKGLCFRAQIIKSFKLPLLGFPNLSLEKISQFISHSIKKIINYNYNQMSHLPSLVGQPNQKKNSNIPQSKTNYLKNTNSKINFILYVCVCDFMNSPTNLFLSSILWTICFYIPAHR